MNGLMLAHMPAAMKQLQGLSLAAKPVAEQKYKKDASPTHGLPLKSNPFIRSRENILKGRKELHMDPNDMQWDDVDVSLHPSDS
jgi:hypothetical protein